MLALKALVSTIVEMTAFYTLWAALSCPFFFLAISQIKQTGVNGLARFEGDAGSAVGLGFAVWLICTLWRKESVASAGYGDRRLAANLLLGAALGFLIMAVVVISLLTSHTASIRGVSLISPWQLLLTSFGLVANVFVQEGLFRGFPLAVVARRYSPTAAAVVTSIMFVSIHGVVYQHNQDAFWGGLNLFLAGLLLSWTVFATGSIWFAIGTHIVWNWLQSPLFGQEGAGYLSGFSGSALTLSNSHGVESTPIGLVGPIAGLIVMAYWHYSQIRRMHL